MPRASSTGWNWRCATAMRSRRSQCAERRRLSESNGDLHTDIARIAELRIELARKVRRLIAEIKPAHRVVLVQCVAYPQRDFAAALSPPEFAVEQAIGA